MKQRLNITIDEEIYYEIIRTGMNKEQKVSDTINKLLKIYFNSSKGYDKTIKELTTQIKNLRLKHYTEVVKEVKEFQEQEKKDKQIRDNIDSSAEALRRNNPLRNI